MDKSVSVYGVFVTRDKHKFVSHECLFPETDSWGLGEITQIKLSLFIRPVTVVHYCVQ